MTDKDIETTAERADTAASSTESAANEAASDEAAPGATASGNAAAGESSSDATAEKVVATADGESFSAGAESGSVTAAATGVAVVTEPVAGEEPEAAPSRWDRVRATLGGRPAAYALRAAAAVTLGASVAAAAFYFVQNKNHEDLLDAQEQARTAACRYGPVLANYDAKNLDPYFTAVLDGATGDWKKQFESTTKELREALVQGEVVSKASDVQCAIRANDKTSAEAIVVIGQSITSLGTKGKPAPGQLSMVMRLEKSGDQWLVNKVNRPVNMAPAP